MSSTKDGIMVILSSPSGAGKTTLVKKISSQENYTISISHTTRTPRINEINGKDYFFVSKKEFKSLINKHEFLEFAEVFKNLYGSSKKSVLKNAQNVKNSIKEIFLKVTFYLQSHQNVLFVMVLLLLTKYLVKF